MTLVPKELKNELVPTHFKVVKPLLAVNKIEKRTYNVVGHGMIFMIRAIEQ